MWGYAAAFAGGVVATIGSFVGIGAYAFRHPKVMAPAARHMTRAMMNRGK